MRRISVLITSLAILAMAQPVFAGEFYKLHPRWLELGYHVVLALLILACFIVSFTIFGNFKGGKLGAPWIIIIIALIVILARTALGILTVFDVRYFQATAFAGLDVLFFVLLLIGLILYKVGLE